MTSSLSHITHTIEGTDSVSKLFVIAFDQATRKLAGSDLWQLHNAKASGHVPPSWLPQDRFGALCNVFGALAARSRSSRYKLRKAERSEIVKNVGDVVAFESGRSMFMLAWCIDDAFSNFATDHPHPSIGSDILPVCTPFLDDIDNAPPSLGQMTPVAICRRWFRNIHVCGRFDSLRGFGVFPAMRRATLPAEVAEALERAKLDEQEIRLALVGWREHAKDGLRLSSPTPGTFAVTGFLSQTRPHLVRDVVSAVRKMKAHFALLPEIALDAQELEELAMYLRSNRARFPCLVAAGLIHRPDGTGHHLNEAVLLSSAGDEILRSRKTEPFHNQTTGEFEDIVGAATAPYQYVDTPVGRLVVSICRDLRSDVQMVLNRAICASLVFVPAYSKRLDFVIEEARVLGQRQSAIVVAVNPSGGGLRDAFAAYAPVRGCAGIRIEQEHIQAGKDLVIALVKVQGAPGQLGEIRADTEMTV